MRLNRREFLRRAAIGGAGTVLQACVPSGLYEVPKSDSNPINAPPPTVAPDTRESLLEMMDNLKPADVFKDQRLAEFTGMAADGYVKATRTQNYNPEQLVSFCSYVNSNVELIEQIRKETDSPDFIMSDFPGTAIAYIDLERIYILRSRINSRNNTAYTQPDRFGENLLTLLWHEWGHLDIQNRNSGLLVENNKYMDSGYEWGKPYVGYHGMGLIKKSGWIDSYRNNEIANEAMIWTLKKQYFGIDQPSQMKRYYLWGADLLQEIIKATVLRDQFYDRYSTSDVDFVSSKIAGLIGDQATVLDGFSLLSLLATLNEAYESKSKSFFYSYWGNYFANPGELYESLANNSIRDPVVLNRYQSPEDYIPDNYWESD